MVQFTKVFYYASRKPLRQFLRTGFRDSLRLYVKAGSGGNGFPKFGGVGGQGGSIFFVAKENLTLDKVLSTHRNKRVVAQHGRDSTKNFILGTPGETVKVEVPVGVSIFTDEGQKIGELNTEGEELIVAKGGVGGHPKNRYMGSDGQAHSVRLDLKLISDIGLVGFPNAGKSTLLNAVSQARPKIASYPFTTIRPNVGIIVYKDLRQISMADLPGLIEGAHANKGMGHSFLKHIERTKMVLLVADINGFQLSPQHTFRSCLDTIVLLNKELEMYNPELLEKPTLIVINKMDTEGALEKFKEIKDKIRNISECFKNYPDEIRPEVPLKLQEVIPISAKNHGEDIQELKRKLRVLLDIFHQESNVDEIQTLKIVKDSQRERGPRLA